MKRERGNLIPATTYSIGHLMLALLLWLMATAADAQEVSVEKVNFGRMGIKLNEKVYTIRSKSRGWWSAGSSRIEKKTSGQQETDPNLQFVFLTPSDEDTTHVYLYSVGRKQLANVTGNANNTPNINLDNYSSTPIYIYKVSGTSSRFSESINNNVNELFTFNEDKSGKIVNANDKGLWAGTYGSNNSDIDNGTLFKAVEVASATFTADDLEQARVLFKQTYDRATLEQLGISTDKVYILVSDYYTNSANQTKHVIVGSNSDQSRLDWFTRDSTTPTEDTTYVLNMNNGANRQSVKFSFVTDKDDPSKIYLYSVATGKAVNSTGQLVNGNSLPQVYLYATGVKDYPLAIGFAPKWNEAGARNLDGSANNNNNNTNSVRLTSTSTAIGPQKRFRLLEIAEPGYTEESARAGLKGWLTQEFHYTGIHGRPLKNGMQDVAEVHYYYYVNTERKEYNRKGTQPAIDLKLPLMRYLARDKDGSIKNRTQNGTDPNTHDDHESSGNNMEPMGYFRWYDYRTDSMPRDGRVRPWRDWNNDGNSPASNNILTEKFDIRGKSLGYFGLNLSNNTQSRIGPCASNIGVYYAIPDSADNKSWKGDVIACDVSRYIDYSTNTTPTTNLQHEPTLSVRYVFHILPANRLADEMRDTIINDGTTITDKGILVFGAKDDNATMNIRTGLQSYSQYYFHPLKPEALKTKHFYHPANEAASHGIQADDFQTTTVHASAVEWRVYNADMNAYRVVATTNSLYFNDMALKIAQGNNADNRIYGLRGDGTDWKDLNGDGTTDCNSQIRRGSACYLVGYVTDGTETNKCPFYNARLELTSNFPKTLSQLTDDHDVSRVDAYFQTNFGSAVATFSFDNENTKQTFTKPEGVRTDGNMSEEPSPFAQRQYSFIYYKLGSYSNLGYNIDDKTHQPLHGDFCLFKSYNGKNKVFYDRTYEKTNGTQYGYFMFTDASDESRMLGYQDFQGSLCAGSQIILSAWVANTSSGSGSSQPELRFNLYGVEKDAQGNDIATKLLGSICSGNFANNANDYVGTGGDPYTTGTWYQVYGVLTLPVESNVARYRYFRIGIDNFCNSTSGADYAIDDINVYQSNSRLTVTQRPALCEDGKPGEIDLKIKANYSVAKELAAADTEDKTVYYRFYNSNGTPITGPNFYGKDHNNYGEAKIPYQVPADSTNFERDQNGLLQVILVDQSFALKADSVYYASVALRNPDQASSWGRQTDVCSFYSNNFNYIRQHIIIPGNQSTSIQLRAACDAETMTDYDAIEFSVIAPDQVAGGSTMLPGVNFDYFLGTRDAMNNITRGTTNLLAALRHYRDHYPTGTDGAGDVVAGTSDKTGYSADDKALIDANRYDAKTNPSGKLFLAASPSLKGFPIPVGRQTILAIPTQMIVTVKLNGRTYTYELCNEPSLITISVMRNGPGIVLGHDDVQYPSNVPYRTVRLGLPQINKMGTTGTLRIPIARRTFGGTNDDVPTETMEFYNSIDEKNPTFLYISNTNDSTIDVSKNVKFAELVKTGLNTAASGDSTINIKNINKAVLHEGYWYEVGFYFRRTDIKDTECPGETYVFFNIVPEYLTWNPTADNGLNSNWNNDVNWTRSTAGELYDATYLDYREPTYQFTLHDANGAVVQKDKYNTNVDTNAKLLLAPQPACYVPMYFSKVTMLPQSSKPYPMLGFIQYSAVNGLPQSLTNEKNHAATANIEYQFEAAPIDKDSVDYYCGVFQGNVCDQILFKTGAQLREQQYLKYNRAWVELALPVNAWGTFTTSMAHTFAGDMYLPKTNAVQATPEFRDIRFTDVDLVDKDGKPWKEGAGEKYGLFGKAGDGLYNRLRMPTYQKLWGKRGNEYAEGLNEPYYTHDEPTQMLIYPSPADGAIVWGSGTTVDQPDFTADRTDYNRHSAWSHTFNGVGAMDKSAGDGYYQAGDGVAGKIGDDYATDNDWQAAHINYYSNGQPMAMANMRLPKADTEFTFYKADGNGGITSSTIKQTIDRKDNYRLSVPYDPSYGALGADTITSDRLGLFINYGLSESNKLYYVLIGNPYTSSISASSFFDANKDVLATVPRTTGEGESATTENVYCYWTLEGNTLKEYKASVRGNYIAPGQSFFVKMKNIPGFDFLYFTTQMQVDPMMQQTAAERAMAQMPAKVYRVDDKEDIPSAIEEGTVEHRFHCRATGNGCLTMTGNHVRRTTIVAPDGRIVSTEAWNGAAMRQAQVGQGLFIVRAELDNGDTETVKVVVR